MPWGPFLDMSGIRIVRKGGGAYGPGSALRMRGGRGGIVDVVAIARFAILKLTSRATLSRLLVCSTHKRINCVNPTQSILTLVLHKD